MNRFGLLFGICLSLFACGGSDPPADPLPAPVPALALEQTARLSLTVIDVDGRFVEGATVSTAAASAVTSSAGTASVDVHSGTEQTVRIAKDGFAEQVKVVNIANGSSGALQSMLIAREAPQTLASNEAGGSVSGKDGVKVTLPAGAFVTADGQAVSGAVQLSLTPVDVTQLDIGAFPGLFEGVPTGGSRSPIVTYGTAELVPQQGGQKLNLAAGKSAEIELPFYVKKHQEGTNVKAGDTVPLWSLDTASGLWQQEGEGTVVLSAASPSGFALRASISHFSWWNIDAVSGRGMVNLVVNVSGSTAPAGTTAAVEGRVVAGSGPQSLASITVPVGTATQLAVSAEATTELTARAELNEQVCTGAVNVNPPANTTVTAVINAICVDVPVPRIVTPSGTSSTNSVRPVRVQVMVDGPVPDTVELFAGSTRIEEFGREFFYTAWWDSSTFAEGRYLLTARATLDGGTRTSAPVEIFVDRTPPRMVSIAPAPGAAVSQATTFTVDFSEPVHSFPFEFTDAVKLAVFPIGSSTPVEIPIAISLSNNQRRLTVQAQATMPLGDVSLTWGGLQDAARNAVGGTVTALYAIDRAPQLFTQAQWPVNHGPPLAITNSGQIVAAWAVGDGTATGGTLHVGLRSGNGFTLFGAPTDNPISDSNGYLRFDMTLDAADRPHIAYTQIAGATSHIVVRRFDNGVWQTLGMPFTGVTSLSGPPRLLVDLAGRPVLAFVRNHTVREVHRFEAATNTWTSLGSLAAVLGGSAPFDIALMPNGDPVVAILTFTAGIELKAARYNGTTWVQLGGVIDISGAEYHFGVRIAGGTNGPWLHYHKVDGTLRLLRFNGSSWEVRDIPKPAGANTIQSPLALGLLNDNPIVVFNDFRLGAYVTRFIDGNFEPIASVIGRPAQLSIVTRGNAVVVGAQDFGSTMLVHQLLFP